jgi:sugar O-acyltransferase (sialic acid O-acetyltransferase NeuD family)
MDLIAVFGSSGHAKAVIDVIEQQGRYEITGIFDSFREPGVAVCGYPVLGSEELFGDHAGRTGCHAAIVAVGDNWQRSVFAERIGELYPWLEFASLVHPSAQISRRASLGRGSVAMAGSVVNADARVGEFCVLNTNCSLDHDARMEDFSSLAPGAVVGGNASIGCFSAISLNAGVLQERKVGRHVVVAAGAVVTRDVPDFTLVAGVPARRLRTRTQGEPYL